MTTVQRLSSSLMTAVDHGEPTGEITDVVRTAVLSAMDEGVLLRDADTNLLFANDAALTLLGVELSVLEGSSPAEVGWVVTDEVGQALRKEDWPFACVLRSGLPMESMVWVSWPGQEPRLLRWRSRPAPLSDGSAGVVSVFRDVTEVARAEIELRAANERLTSLTGQLHELTEATGDVHFVQQSEPERRFEYVSESVTALLGYSPDEFYADPSLGERLLDSRDQFEAPRIDSVALGEVIEEHLRGTARDGSTVWLHQRARKRLRVDGSVVIEGSARDVTEIHRVQEALAASEARFRLAMAEAPHGMAIIDLDHNFVEVNSSLCAMLGHDETWFRSHSMSSVLAEVDADPRAVEMRMRRADGEEIWVQQAIGVLRDVDGRPTSLVAHFQDITERRRLLAELEHMATHDGLTGLSNRWQLTDQLAALMVRSRRTGSRIAVLFCDIDGLKPINDRYGHSAGDAIIMATASRLLALVRSGDLVARIGGDEFVVVLDGVDDVHEATRVAEFIRKAMDGPVQHDDVTLTSTLSIGVAMVEDDHDPDRVIDQADDALYQAKRAGRDQVVVSEQVIDLRDSAPVLGANAVTAAEERRRRSIR
jgi:diguanylate cyclase (GGDEF)-like protein/PAS domain S-box-containing protein